MTCNYERQELDAEPLIPGLGYVTGLLVTIGWLVLTVTWNPARTPRS